MAHIEIETLSLEDGSYHVCVVTQLGQLTNESNLLMTRDELKQLRNMTNNLLLDLNQELNYEE